MYAIVRTGGKQYQVSPGSIIAVEKLNAEAGQDITLDEVLLINDGENVVVGKPTIEGGSVTAKVIGQEKAKKIKVFKFKRRKQYRKMQGHRQQHTRIRIQDILGHSSAETVTASEPQQEIPSEPETSVENITNTESTTEMES